MLKSLRFMLLAVLTTVCGTIIAQEETTVTWEASSKDPLTTIYPDANISLKWEEGGGEFSPKYSGETVYFYNGNRVIVSGVSADVTITKVVFTFTGEKYSIVTCNASGKNESSADITGNSEKKTSTWLGEANNVIFRAARQTGARNITSIAVTYTGGTTGPVVTVPVLNITQDNLSTTYSMDETPTFAVYAKNDGNLAAQNVWLTLYVDGQENASAEIGTLAIGQEVWKNFKYDVTKFEAGEHQVKLALTANNADAFEVEKTVTFTKKAPQATFELTAQNVEVQLPADKITIKVNVKNTSDIDAANVKINLWKNGIIATETIAALAAGKATDVTFTIDALAAGTYEMHALTADNMYGCTFSVTVLAEEEPEVKDLAINSISGTIDQASETSVVRVIVLNNGNVDIANATVTLTAGQTVLGTATASATAGQAGWANIAVATAGLTPGSLEVTATVEVEGDATPADNTMTTTLEVKAAPAPEATLQVTVQNVEVELAAQTVKVVVNVKNTSEVKLDQAEVKILKGIDQLGESKYVCGLEAGAEQNVTIEIPNFTEAGTYELQAFAGKFGTYFNVIVKEPVVDLAIESVQGTIDLAEASSNVTVNVKNNGTADVKDAVVTLTASGNVLGTANVSVKAGEQGYAYIQVATGGLEAGELSVIATVEVGSADATPADNIKTATLTVKAADAAEATFSVVAQNVTVPFGAESFDIVATITNTSNVAAHGLTVKLLKGINVIMDETLNLELPAGESYTKTYTFHAPFDAGTTVTYYVQAGEGEGQGQAEVVVTFEDETAEEKVDLAVTAIQGSLSLNVENNSLTVFVENNGTVDMTDVLVRLTIGNGVYTGTIASIKAGKSGFCSFTIPAADLWAGRVTVTATVTAENDANTADNTLEKTYTVAAPQPELSFTVADVTTKVNASSFDVKVTVKNSEKAAAENVVVTVYDENSARLGTTTIENLAAGAEQTVNVTVLKTYTQPGTFKNQLQVTVSGVDGVKWADVTVEDITTAIQAIRAKYGKHVEIYSITGKKVSDVRRGFVYIINGKKVTVK